MFRQPCLRSDLLQKALCHGDRRGFLESLPSAPADYKTLFRIDERDFPIVLLSVSISAKIYLYYELAEAIICGNFFSPRTIYPPTDARRFCLQQITKGN